MGWLKENLKTVIIVGVVVSILGFYGGIKVADRPFFCGMLCHEMAPHVDTLKESLHAKNDVICMDCHSHQGFFNRAYEHIISLAFVPIHFSKIYLEDEHNLHANVEGFDKEKMDFKNRPKSEWDQIKKECLKCHPNRVPGSFFMKVPDYKQEMLNENCHRCHEEVVESAEENLEEAKKLITAETEKPKAIGNIHPLHVSKDILCSKCHNRVVHSTEPPTHTPGMNICLSCHNGEETPKIEECQSCHNGPRNVFAGTGAKEVEAEAGYMAEEECVGCHNEEKGLKFSKGLCIACHDDDEEYLATLREWQVTFSTKLALLTESYETIKDLIEKGVEVGRVPPDVQEKFKEAEYNYLFVSQDKSKGVHNVDFTDSLLDNVKARLNEVKGKL